MEIIFFILVNCSLLNFYKSAAAGLPTFFGWFLKAL
jgi:hypothetical protein